MLRSRGFTLIELLVVISIIALLSSVVLSSLNSVRAKARDARRFEDVDQLSLAIRLYADANNVQFPSGCGNTWYCLGHSDGRDGGNCWNNVYYGCAAADAQIKQFISAIPDDPLNDTTKAGDAYMYFPLYTNATLGFSNEPVIHWGMEKAPLTDKDCGNGGKAGQWGGSPYGTGWYCVRPLNR